MHNRIIKLINQHLDIYYDPLLISKEDYNKFDNKELKKMKKSGWIIDELYTFTFQFNPHDISKLEFDGEAMIADQFISEIIKEIYTDIFLKVKKNNNKINSIGFHEIMKFNNSYFINPSYLSKIVMTIDRYNLAMHSDEIEGWDPKFEKLFTGRRYLTNPFWISNIVNSKYIYAFTDTCVNNTYHITNINYEMEKNDTITKITFNLNVDFFPMLKQIKIYSL